ncbi:MAG TPA: hypothetical protein VGV57_06525 [Thermoleophilaceae bacterium]|nr:hypothetical protein [Thermoleophilaceae bacterium]
MESSDGYGEADFGGLGDALDESYTGDALDESYIGDALDEGDSDDAESRRSRRRAQVARRKAALAQSRATRARSARSGSRSAQAPMTSAAVRDTQAAVAEVDLANKVLGDRAGAALEAQGKRIGQSELALVTSIVGAQAKESFRESEFFKNKLVAAGVGAAPLLLLGRGRRGSGVNGFVSDRRVLGFGAIAGLVFAEQLTRKSQEVSDVRIRGSVQQVPVNLPFTFQADAVDASGRVIGEKRQSISWTLKSTPDGIATIDNRTGEFKASKPGNVVITATGERPELSAQAVVEVIPTVG